MIFKYFDLGNYFELASIILALAAATSLKSNANENKDLHIIKLYLYIYILLFVASYYYYFMQLDFVFTIFEFFVFSNYLKKAIPAGTFLWGTRLFYIISTALLPFVFILAYNESILILFVLYNVQATILLIFASIYYVALFKSNNGKDLISSYWIITGITILLISTLPFSILSYHIWHSNFHLFDDLFAIIPAFYSMLFLFIILSAKNVPYKSFLKT